MSQWPESIIFLNYDVKSFCFVLFCFVLFCFVFFFLSFFAIAFSFTTNRHFIQLTITDNKNNGDFDEILNRMLFLSTPCRYKITFIQNAFQFLHPQAI